MRVTRRQLAQIIESTLRDQHTNKKVLKEFDYGFGDFIPGPDGTSVADDVQSFVNRNIGKADILGFFKALTSAVLPISPDDIKSIKEKYSAFVEAYQAFDDKLVQDEITSGSPQTSDAYLNEAFAELLMSKYTGDTEAARKKAMIALGALVGTISLVLAFVAPEIVLKPFKIIGELGTLFASSPVGKKLSSFFSGANVAKIEKDPAFQSEFSKVMSMSREELHYGSSKWKEMQAAKRARTTAKAAKIPAGVMDLAKKNARRADEYLGDGAIGPKMGSGRQAFIREPLYKNVGEKYAGGFTYNDILDLSRKAALNKTELSPGDLDNIKSAMKSPYVFQDFLERHTKQRMQTWMKNNPGGRLDTSGAKIRQISVDLYDFIAGINAVN